jgi:hypothetical protein
MRHFGAMVLLFAVGCDNAQLPVQPTLSLPAPTLPEFRLSGSVRDTASRSLGGSRVEIVAGPNAGTFTTTNEHGRFSMPGSFTGVVTVRASKDGYTPETMTVPSPRALDRLPATGGWDWSMSFDLAPLGPSANLAGMHTLTLTADRACTTLPQEARTRTYTATITPGFRSTSFNATLSDARFPTFPCLGRPADSCVHNQFGIGIAGDFANMSVGIVEQLNETAYLAIEGGVAASFGASGITAPFSANFLYCPTKPEWTSGEYWACPADGGVQAVECNSGRHQLALLRR